MASRAKGKHPAASSTASVRHYPLDLPSGLPFERYQHRPISKRDILVGRILPKLLRPSTPELAEALARPRPAAFATSRRRASDDHDPHLVRDARGLAQDLETFRLRHHNFGPLKTHDPALARDVEILRKSLTTSLTSEWSRDPAQPQNPRFAPSDRDGPSETSRLSVQDEAMDIIRLYFMETDDAAMRIWLNLLQTTRGATYETLAKVPAPDKTRRAASQWRRSWEQRHAKFQHKEWYPEDQARLRSVRLANDLPRLYDGGFFVTGLYQNVFEHRGLILLDKSLIKKRGLIHGNVVGIQNVFLWPEEVGVPLPFLHLPSYNYRSVLRRDFQYKPKFASASTRGPGLDRDGIWSTGGDTFDTRFRGRTRRRQGRRWWRAATSEPPQGLFMASRLPTTHALAQELIVFPR